MSDKLTHKQVVEMMIGPISPTGDHGEDQRRYGNLNNMLNLIEDLVIKTCHIVENKDEHAWSIRNIGQLAEKRLRAIQSEIGEYIDCENGERK